MLDVEGGDGWVKELRIHPVTGEGGPGEGVVEIFLRRVCIAGEERMGV